MNVNETDYIEKLIVDNGTRVNAEQKHKNNNHNSLGLCLILVRIAIIKKEYPISTFTFKNREDNKSTGFEN